MKIAERHLEVDKEKGVCISRILDSDDTYDETQKVTSMRTAAIAAILYDFDDIATFDTVYEGVAKCHGEDKFDEYKGTDLACTRADMKYHRRLAKDYQKYINYCEKAIQEFQTLKEMHEKKVANIEHDIQTHFIDKGRVKKVED